MLGQFAIGEAAIASFFATLITPFDGTGDSYNELFGQGSHLIDPSIKGWWKLDDNAASSTVLDYSGNDYHGTFYSGGAEANTSGNSTTGYSYNSAALDFNGSNEYVEIPSSVLNEIETNQTWTMGCFANPETSIADGRMMGQWHGSNEQLLMWYDVDGSGKGLAAIVRADSNRITGVDDAHDPVWSAWASSWDGSTIVTNVDGVQQSSAAASGTMASLSRSFFIGRDKGGAGAKSFTGPIANAFLASRSWSESELSEYANGPEPTRLVDPVLSQTSEKISVTAGAWDNAGNGTVTVLYQYEVADDSSGTNAEDRAATATMYPKAGDNGKYVRVSVSGSNNGDIDSAETWTSAWTLITADAPATEGAATMTRGELNNTGTTDFTVTGFGNVAAAIFIFHESDGTSATQDGQQTGWGFQAWSSNGALNDNKFSTADRRDDNASSGDFCWRSNTNSHPIFLTSTGQSWTVAPITDGVRATVSTSGTDTLQCTVIMFDENCTVITDRVSQTDGAWDDIDFEFSPSAVFQASGCAPITGTSVSAFQSIGAIDNDGNAWQMCTSMERNNLPTDIGISLTSDDWARQYAYGSISWTATPTWANSGYSLSIAGGSAGTDTIPYIAIGNIGAKCGTQIGPRSTDPGAFDGFDVAFSGDTTVTPDVVLFGNSLLNSAGSNPGTSAEAYGYGFDDGSDPHSYGVYQQYNVNPSNTAAMYDGDDSQTVYYDAGTAPAQVTRGRISEMNEGEFVIDYDGLGGNPYIFGYLAFGTTGSTPPPASSIVPLVIHHRKQMGAK